MIDSHCHIDCAAFDADRHEALDRAGQAGVEAVVVPAVDESTWQPILDLRQRPATPRCYPALGIHPVALPAMDPNDDDAVLSRLEALVAQSAPTAIGECGIDSTIDLTRAPMDRQERVLLAHLALARRFGLPVILHARGPSTYERLPVLLAAQPGGWTGVIHSFGGGAELLKKFLPLPLHFGFAGPATYKNARKVRASIAAIPDDRLLAETDAPDQTPEPHRPGRSEPAYVAAIIRGLAEARGTTEETIRDLTTANARRLFRLT
jgi:TatD DNase family protein